MSVILPFVSRLLELGTLLVLLPARGVIPEQNPEVQKRVSCWCTR